MMQLGTIGPFWVTISTGIMVLTVGIVYGQIFSGPNLIGAAGYIPYFAVGIVVWSFISATIAEGCGVFITSSSLIKALKQPLPIHVYRMLLRNVILLGHNALIVVLLWAVFQWHAGWSLLLVLPGFVLLVSAVFGMVLVLAIRCRGRWMGLVGRCQLGRLRRGLIRWSRR